MSQRSGTEQFSVQFVHQQASRLSGLYNNYQNSLPSPGRNELLESMYGAKLLDLFKWVDTHPEAQKLLQDYHQRELEHEHMTVIKAYDDGPPLTDKDPAENVRLSLMLGDAMRSAFLGAV